MSRKIVLHVNLPEDTKKRLVAYASAKGISQGSVVDAALRDYFNETLQADLILTELGRLRRGIGRLERNADITDAALAGYIQMWLAYKPPMAADQKQKAQAQAADRFDQFITFLQTQLEQQRTFSSLVAEDDLMMNKDIRALLDMEQEGKHE